MKVTEYPRRIRADLSDEIMRLYMRDFFDFEGEPEEISQEESREFVELHPELKNREFNLEKALWALDQQIQLWEDSAIQQGKCLYAIKKHETPERYLQSLKRICEGKMSMELADAYIQAYKEDRQNG